MEDQRRRSTKPLHERIAFVFDFDDTLAPDTVSAFVESCGLDPDTYWEELVQPLIRDGWDPIPAAFHPLIEKTRRNEIDIRRSTLEEFGKKHEIFDGVETMFGRLRGHAQAKAEGVRVEFYVVSCGVKEIIEASPIAGELDGIWACEFHYDDEERLDSLKVILSHSEKTRYLQQISKGIDPEKGRVRPFEVHREVPESDLHVPLSQMVYVGDGLTDIPCFALLAQEEGVTLGLFKENSPEKWGPDSGIADREQIENLARPDYGEGSELMRSLCLAIDKICSEINLLRMSRGE